MAAQDQGELFDLLDSEGRPLGVRKARHLVHRDGDWHRSLHIWVVLAEGPGAGEDAAPWVLFQRRSAAKDTWPLAIDVAVTGHFGAGEQLEDALREAEEEIGLPLSASDVARLGLRRRTDAHAPPLLDRELQDVLLCTTRLGLMELRPHPEEVAALLSIPLLTALALVRGEAASARGQERNAAADALAPVDIRLADFVGGADDGYYALALDTIRRRLDGEAPPPWTLG